MVSDHDIDTSEMSYRVRYQQAGGLGRRQFGSYRDALFCSAAVRRQALSYRLGSLIVEQDLCSGLCKQADNRGANTSRSTGYYCDPVLQR